MIDYCLLACLFSNDISSYKIYGDFFELHTRVRELMEHKQIKEVDNPELVIINNESNLFFDYYWKNELKPSVKWLFITLEDNTSMDRIYREIRYFAESAIIINADKPIIILKNIKHNFQSFYRHDILQDITSIATDDFFNFKIEKQNLDYKFVKERMVNWPGDGSETREESLIKVMTLQNNYIYYGNQIDENSLELCKMLCNMKINIIECVSDFAPTITCGWFCKKELIKDILLYTIYPHDSIKKVLRFKEQKLTVPVRRIK